ncbi:NAD(P)-dependent alcohol dehydrogenase [Actinomadura sp. KC216]|nr:NAD(P)-dependent alcohol dehydrogenase [Actinomadura sp. KC216]
MKALAFLGTNRVGLIEKPIPEPGPDDVVVRTTMSSICTSDIHTISGAVAIPLDQVLGHESVGIVHRLGEKVKGFREGDRVAVGGVTPCGRCDYCQSGHPTQCGGMLGGYKWTVQRDGNLAEYFRVPDAAYNLVAVPEAVSDEQALYALDVMSTGIVAAQNAQIPVGGTVAIFAQGPVGLCTTIGVRLLGAGLVITTATRPDRARLSSRLGADVVINPRAEDAVEQIRAVVGQPGVDSAIEALGSHQTFEECIRATKPGGTIVNVGYHGWASQAPLPVPIVSFGMGLSDKTIRAVLASGGREHLQRMFRLLETGRVDPTPLTTHRMRFDEVERAFRLMCTKEENIIKPLITY